MYLNFEENQQLTAFWEWGIGNGELARKPFYKIEMLPSSILIKLSFSVSGETPFFKKAGFLTNKKLAVNLTKGNGIIDFQTDGPW